MISTIGAFAESPSVADTGALTAAEVTGVTFAPHDFSRAQPRSDTNRDPHELQAEPLVQDGRVSPPARGRCRDKGPLRRAEVGVPGSGCGHVIHLPTTFAVPRSSTLASVARFGLGGRPSRVRRQAVQARPTV